MLAQANEGITQEDESAVYYFESDHVALKESADYRNVLHTIAVLEAQRQQAAKDIEILYNAQDKALSDPLSFVADLQQGKDMGFPQPQKIASLPNIQWSKYINSVNFTSFVSSRHMTRNKKNASEGNADSVQSLKSKLIQGHDNATSDSNDSSVVVVRGRTKDSTKPTSFNQLWTEEEQQRLESLLIKYPPEEVELRRWEKIANALGNRTPVQVASRVQKYFLRLAKEGLPVPGRMPNLTAHTKKGSHRHQRYNRLYFSNSTLLQSHVPPVWMPDEVEDVGPVYNHPSSSNSGFDTPVVSDFTHHMDDSSDEESFPEDIRNTPEYQELQRLKQIRREKVAKAQATVIRHVGYKCDNCGSEPIIGTRWHCRDCPAEDSYDLCDECSDVPNPQGILESFRRSGLRQNPKKKIPTANLPPSFKVRIKPRPKTNAERCADYRNRLRTDPDAWKTHCSKSQEISRRYRRREKTLDELAHEREMARERQRRYREKKKQQLRINEESGRRQTRQEVKELEERRLKNRLAVRKHRENQTRQKKAAEKAKRRSRYAAQKNLETNPPARQRSSGDVKTHALSLKKKLNLEGTKLIEFCHELLKGENKDVHEQINANLNVPTTPVTPTKQKIRKLLSPLKKKRDKDSLSFRQRIANLIGHKTVNMRKSASKKLETVIKEEKAR